MKHLKSKAPFIALSAVGCMVLCVAMSAPAQSYSIDWYKIAGGGGTSTGGNLIPSAAPSASTTLAGR